MLAASGANEPAYPTEIHVTAGGKRGEESIDCGSPDVIDKETFKNFVTDLSDDLKQNFDIGIDFQRYHDAGKNNQDLFTKKQRTPTASTAFRYALPGQFLAGICNECSSQNTLPK